MTKVSKTCIDLEEELIDRFRELFPQHGSIKWFFNEVLRAFIEVHDPNRVDREIFAAVEFTLIQEARDDTGENE